MKTAISIPDELFESAERYAKERGISRSELYASAVREYLAERRDEAVTKKLDEIYGEDTDDRLDPALSRMQTLSLPKEEW